MTASTSRRWFAPNPEFYASLRDYAVVGLDASYVRDAINFTNSVGKRSSLSPLTFAALLGEPNHCYLFAAEADLVYADVDEENPQHKEEVYGRIAKEALLDEESDDAKSAREKLVEHVREKWPGVKKAARDASDAEEFRRAVYQLEAMVQGNNIDDDVFDYILRADTEAAKKELLNTVSGQTRQPTKRPVLLLIDVIDDMQSKEVGVTTGWAIGYDFVKDLLIIKPFLSNKDRHPLGGSWYAPVQNDDGIIYSGSPKTFAEKYVLAAKDLQDAKTAGQTSLESTSLPAEFKPYVHTVAATWIARFWAALSSSPSAGNDFPSAETIQAAVASHSGWLSTVPVPTHEKQTPESVLLRSLSSLSICSSCDDPLTDAGSDTEKDIGPTVSHVWQIRSFLRIQHILETEEFAVRAAAVRAKRAGDEQRAERAAEIWEELLKLVNEINDWGWGEGRWDASF